MKNNYHSILPHRNIFLLTGIFILSLLLRAVHLIQLKSTPLFAFFAGDSSTYHELALEILKGNFLDQASLHLSPLYPFFIAAVYKLTGKGIVAVSLVQIILDSLTCLFLYFISLKIFNKKNLALLSSFIYAAYSMAIFYSGFLLDTTLVTFLNVTLILLLFLAKEKKSSVLWASAGVVLGLSLLLKAAMLLFLPFLLFWVFSSSFKNLVFKSKLKNAIFVLLGIIIMLTPFSLRNYAINKTLTPFPVQGGFNFYIGNNPEARGTYTSFIGIPDAPIKQVDASVMWARKHTEKDLSYNEASNYWLKRGLRFIKNDKMSYLSLTLRKLFLFWNDEEILLNLNYYFCRKFIPILTAPFFTFGFIAPFSLFGLIFIVKEKKTDAYPVIFIVFAYMLSLIVFYVSSRLRFSSIPFISIFAVYGLASFIRTLRSRKGEEIITFAVILLSLFMITNKETAAVNSKNSFSHSYNRLGKVYERSGDLDQAIILYQRSIEAAPDYLLAHFNLGNAYYQKNLTDKAVEKYHKVLEIDPLHPETHNNLASYYFYVKGDKEKAFYHCVTAIEQGFEPNPEFMVELFGAKMLRVDPPKRQ